MILRRKRRLIAAGVMSGFCGGFAAVIAARLGPLMRAKDQEILTDDVTLRLILREEDMDESFNSGPV